MTDAITDIQNKVSEIVDRAKKGEIAVRNALVEVSRTLYNNVKQGYDTVKQSIFENAHKTLMDIERNVNNRVKQSINTANQVYDSFLRTTRVNVTKTEKKSNDITEAFKAAADNISSKIINTVLQPVLNKIKEILSNLNISVDKITENASSFFGDVVKKINSKIQSVVENIVKEATKLLTPITEVLKSVFAKLKEKLSSSLKDLADAFNNLKEKLQSAYKTLTDNINSTLNDFSKALTDFSISFNDTMKEIFTTIDAEKVKEIIITLYKLQDEVITEIMKEQLKRRVE